VTANWAPKSARFVYICEYYERCNVMEGKSSASVATHPLAEHLDFRARNQTYSLILRNVPASVPINYIHRVLCRFGGIDTCRVIETKDAAIGDTKLVKVTFFARSSAQAAKLFAIRTRPFDETGTPGHALSLAGSCPKLSGKGGRSVVCTASKSTSEAARKGNVLSARKCVALLNSEFPLRWSNTIHECKTACKHHKPLTLEARSGPTSATEVGMYVMDRSALSGIHPEALDRPNNFNHIPSEASEEALDTQEEGAPDGAKALTGAIWVVNNMLPCTESLLGKLPYVQAGKQAATAMRPKQIPGKIKSMDVCVRVRMQLDIHQGVPLAPSLGVLGDGGCTCLQTRTVDQALAARCAGSRNRLSEVVPADSELMAELNGLSPAAWTIPDRVDCLPPGTSQAFPVEDGLAGASWNGWTFAPSEICLGQHIKSAVCNSLQDACVGLAISKRHPQQIVNANKS
jgi:hypothetical protein